MTTRSVGATAFGFALLAGLTPVSFASAATTPRHTGDSSYGPCYYNPIPCNNAQGQGNRYANPPLPNSKPQANVHILPPPDATAR
ncbi:hypothetical protein [Segniliparus rugosus]|nr:hypothetical protein [Segniliparus rugosus]